MLVAGEIASHQHLRLERKLRAKLELPRRSSSRNRTVTTLGNSRAVRRQRTDGVEAEVRVIQNIEHVGLQA